MHHRFSKQAEVTNQAKMLIMKNLILPVLNTRRKNVKTNIFSFNFIYELKAERINNC